MKRLFLFFFLLPILAAHTQTTATSTVDITAEPSHHLALDNEHVRVFKVEVPPQTSTLMHRHAHDYAYVTIGDAHLSNEVDGKSPVDVKLANGDTRFTPGNFAHLVRNLSDHPFRNVTIEFAQDDKLRQMPSTWPDEGPESGFPGGRRKILFVKDGVRVSEITLEAGGVVPSMSHDHPHLLVAINDLSDVEGLSPTHEQFASGEIKWFPGENTPALTNKANVSLRFVMVEFGS